MEWTRLRTHLLPVQNDFIANFDSWNAQSFYFLDNNQNILEMICRYDLNNHSDQAFTSISIINISEIGIVTDQPARFAEEFIKQIPVDYFSKGPKSDEFVALGDDNGLLVISNPNRYWFPTQFYGEKWKLKGYILVDEIVYSMEVNSSLS